MKKKTNEKQGLKIEINDSKLVISIGLDILKYALENGDNWDGKITNIKGFAIDMINDHLNNEDEQGTTPVHILFDEAARQAIEQGSEHWEESEGEE
jgi:hypothetical protein